MVVETSKSLFLFNENFDDTSGVIIRLVFWLTAFLINLSLLSRLLFMQSEEHSWIQETLNINNYSKELKRNILVFS